MDAVTGIIIIVWGILCFILFFKVWRMCNDVKRIREIMENRQIRKPTPTQTKESEPIRKNTTVNKVVYNPWQ